MRVPWLLGLAAMTWVGSAAAEDAPEAPRVVDVRIAATDPEADATERVLRELLARLDVDVRITRIAVVDPRDVITPPPDPAPAVARVWIDRAAGAATLYVVDSPWERVLVRRVPSGGDEVAREALAHILETAIDALLHGGRLGVEREKLAYLAPSPAAPPPHEPLPAPGPPRTGLVRGELALLYEAQLFGPGGVVRQGPEASLFVGLARDRVRPGIMAEMQYRIPVVVDDALVALRLDSMSARGLAVLDVALADRLAFRAGIGGGLDFDQVSPRTGTDPLARTGGAAGVLVPLVRATLGGSYALERRLAIDFGLAADFDFTRTRYLAEGAGGAVVDFAPLPVRPALFVGLAGR